jgi:hypothetical protein
MLSRTHLSQIHPSPRLVLAFALTVSIGLTAAIPPALCAQERSVLPRGYGVTTRPSKMLTLVAFSTPNGAIDVNLPLNLHVGDATLVTVLLVPRGHTDQERSVNGAALADCVLILGDQQAQAAQSVRRWLVAPGSNDGADITLKDVRNREAAPVVLKVAVPLVPLTSANEIATAGPRLMPKCGTAGRPLGLPQPALSGQENIAVLIGGKPAMLLAASPRELVVESPREVIGKTTLEVKQGDRTLYEGNFRNDRLHGRTNPWPWLIAGVGALGIVTGIAAHDAAVSFANGFKNLHF